MTPPSAEKKTKKLLKLFRVSIFYSGKPSSPPASMFIKATNEDEAAKYVQNLASKDLPKNLSFTLKTNPSSQEEVDFYLMNFKKERNYDGLLN